jgi:hypothetical protein
MLIKGEDNSFPSPGGLRRAQPSRRDQKEEDKMAFTFIFYILMKEYNPIVLKRRITTCYI